MPNLNKIMLIGNLTRDPEIKHTQKGTPIASFAIAINRSYTTESGEKREDVTFVDIEAYGRIAEIIGQYCRKGRPLFIEGRLRVDTWDDKETGQKRSRMKVVAESIQLLGGRDGVPTAVAEEADAVAARRSAHAPAAQENPDIAKDDISF